ncbi:MAG: ATP-binding protein [Acidiferrobacterales bacterium]
MNTTPTNTEQITEDSIFKIGKVISVKGRAIEIRVDKTKNTSHLVYKGEILKNISVGGYVKIIKGFTVIIGKVEGELITEDRLFAKKQGYTTEREKIHRILTVSLLGFFKGKHFERGIKELPLIDNECFLLHKKEFEQVHDFIKIGDEPITIGSLSFEKGQDIRVGVNGLFASHIGIFGNTGSGKSYTLAKIYRELFLKYKDERKFKRNARFFLLDFNGEYVTGSVRDHIIIDKKYKNTYSLSTRTPQGMDKFPVTRVTLNDPDFWVVFLEATEKTQMPFLRRSVDNSYIAPKVKDADELKALIGQMIYEATTESDRNVEKTVVFNLLKELRDCLGGNQSIGDLFNDYNAHLKFHSNQSKYYYQDNAGNKTFSDALNFRTNFIEHKVAQIVIDVDQITPIDEVRLQIVIQYYNDIIRGFSNKEHLAPLLKRLDKRVDDLKKVIEVKSGDQIDNKKNITIVSLKDVNMHMRKILPLLLCKKLYNDKKIENDDTKYLNLIVDEAHNILSEDSTRESMQWKDYRLETFEEIIKEGRKFGVFLTLASQRPADISPTIISQLHNYFVHRLINNEDINSVKQTISYLDRVSFEYLPLLPTGTCILAGLLANVPIVLDIGKIEPTKHEPKNKTITLNDKWA